jgi:pyruvate/2-oxoglutarate dehydrogenase complex dihydrolipoamide dehydrogenase (E3) component
MSPQQPRYDAIVIGSGQGGSPLAQAMAAKGWRVALVERRHVGGTCINTGCTPTKTMVASAQIAHYARHAARWGVRTGPVSVDLARVVARKRDIVERFRTGKEESLKATANLDLYREHARFVDAHRIAIADRILEGERIFINTGTRPAVDGIDGLAGVPYLTNSTLMELSDLPEHLLVIGGGYIGLEFGQMFHRFGARVTIVHRGAQLLPREDTDVAEELRAIVEHEGLRVLLDAHTRSVERSPAGITLHVDAGGRRETLAGSHLLVATGRRPNTDDLGLDRTGVATDSNGFVTVNNRLETNVPGIWALGDVKGGPAFTHISYNDYQIIYANLFEDRVWTTDDRPVPYSVFTDPQLGRVGLTEREARARGGKLKIGKIPMTYVARAIERDETAGFMKLVVDAETDRILGAAILGSEGGELVQMLGALMLAGAPYTLLKGAVYIHPTLAEGFYALMDAVAPVN